MRSHISEGHSAKNTTATAKKSAVGYRVNFESAMNFSGKNILVTGGSRGIGKAVALAFAVRGGRVCISFHKNNNAAKQVIEELPGVGHFAVRADISDPNEVEKMMQAISNEFDRLDVVVNNAGIYLRHPVAGSDYTEWQKAWSETLALNLTGAANVCYFAAKQMIKNGGGHIVNITSRGAFRGEPEHTAYGASKAGLNALTQSLAKELGPYNIIVSAVAPGFVETDMTKHLLQGEEGEAIRNQSPLGRVATLAEVANAVVFLASGEADFLTGSILDVNGASYLR
jgi:NAD(P)-dependent dehydrogenase (short-subunit alcohol dehydrogenase family)